MRLDKLVEELEQEAVLPRGREERFSGYGVLGVSFSAGDVLALRHFAASSVGPAYSSVWHQSPEGIWDFYTDVAPQLSCTRYFGKAVAKVSVTPVHINWEGPEEFSVRVESPRLEWWLKLKSTASTSFLNLLSGVVPRKAWKSEKFLEKIERFANDVLQAGALTLSGRAPNGQRFMANPHLVRLVESSKATLEGKDLGPVVPLPQQAHIGQFCIPQKGMFVVGHAYFEPFNPEIHDLVTHIQTTR